MANGEVIEVLLIGSPCSVPQGECAKCLDLPRLLWAFAWVGPWTPYLALVGSLRTEDTYDFAVPWPLGVGDTTLWPTPGCEKPKEQTIIDDLRNAFVAYEERHDEGRVIYHDGLAGGDRKCIKNAFREITKRSLFGYRQGYRYRQRYRQMPLGPAGSTSGAAPQGQEV